ncbi:hypothetical protein SAMN05880590_102755 [Rhizobium sp. RU35A]|nr:hypothetical protein SAMN05880590_102755 [Rhizobium sp. RU35A]
MMDREIPAEAKIPCADPVTLPDRDLGEAEVHSLWGRDRTSLRICKVRQGAAISASAEGSHVQ